ncbi:glycosyltransferase family 8 protein [Streptococcus himalayensis]|nr:glycosyltransferase family 8 protein [Streptococcus himalayensis]
MNIVMAADYRMHEQVEVTMKSVLQYHQGVQFFLLNKDYPTEWFERLNNHMRHLDSVIHNKEIRSQEYEQFRTYHYVTEATFYRYHIPELVDEEKVLYLDADIIVTGDLQSFYDLDMTNYGMAAVADPIVAFDRHKTEFNAGVMLVNNKKWREKMVLKEALKMHRDSSLELRDADQSVLNILFRNDWLAVDETYNYQIAATRPDMRQEKDMIRGRILHYTTAAKPFSNKAIGIKHGLKLWLKRKISFREYLRNTYTVPFADEWYQVQRLSWEEIEETYGK